jgi:hypothetical protein
LDLGAPDVCLPGPVPYPNEASRAMGVAVVDSILMVGGPAHNLGTVVPLSVGDNGGVLGGVASGTMMGPSRRLTGSTTILLKGKPGVRLTSLGPQNNGNCVGTTVVPSQTKVLFLAG